GPWGKVERGRYGNKASGGCVPATHRLWTCKGSCAGLLVKSLSCLGNLTADGPQPPRREGEVDAHQGSGDPIPGERVLEVTVGQVQVRGTAPRPAARVGRLSLGVDEEGGKAGTRPRT